MMSAPARELFRDLVDVPPEEWERVLAERQIPTEVWAEVESLLRHDESLGQSLTRRVSVAVVATVRARTQPPRAWCGPYRLVELLGSGGMGAVYLGERNDGEIQHKVAIKLLRGDADRPALRDRFLRERQFLADLNHPAIARLLDAGHTEDERPYLVMEYVQGVAIDEYATALDLRGRLKLFLQVCDGVSHAHRHLIIHRDLKPSNILVDSEGHPKLLDFGIAKLLDISADETRTVERLLTPNYASPEQIRGDVQTTATDVFSLGAVLHKLLRGHSPREFSTTAPWSGQATTGTQTQPNPKLPKDIESILQKALRQEPKERYASVDAFADDIRAFLESRPVKARSGDAWYRTRKLFQRYWLPIASAALVIACLSAGIWIVNRERRIATRRFDEVRQLSSKLFDIDLVIRELPGATKARQAMVDTSLDYLRRLRSETHGDPDLMLDLGNAYMRVARVQGVPIGPNLGQMENAEQNLRIAEDFIRSVLQAQPDNRTAMLRAAQIAHDRMRLAAFRRPDTAALPLAYQCEEWLEKYLAGGTVDAAETDQVLLIGIHVANWYAKKWQYEDALRLMRRMIKLGTEWNLPYRVGTTRILLARILRSMGDLEGALAACREGVKLLEPRPGDVNYISLRAYRLALVTQGEVLGEDYEPSLGRFTEAAELFDRGFQMAVDLARRDPDDIDSKFSVANDGIRLAGVLRHSDPRRALAVYDRVLEHSAAIPKHPRARRDEVRALAWSTYPLRELGRFSEARSRLDAAFQRLKDLKLYPAERVDAGSEPLDALRALAEYEAGRGNVRRANAVYQELLQLLNAAPLNPEFNLTEAFHLSNVYRAGAVLHRRAGQLDQASSLTTRDVQLWRHWDRALPHNSFVRGRLESADHR
jgi:tetratricopeptide (TPR) repeat protein/predicted Ser/Thr protein kinase